jgi:hypothetical protein
VVKLFRSTVVGLAIASGGCIVVFGLDPLSERAPDSGAATDAGTDAPKVDAGIDAGPCQVDDIGLARPTTSAPIDGPPRILLAFTSLDIGVSENAEPPGLDLDRRGERPSCVPRGPIATRDGGVDNASASFLQTVGTVFPAISPTSIDLRLKSHIFGIVLALELWNGTPNDERVQVSLFATIEDAKFSDGGLMDGGAYRPDKRFLSGTTGSKLLSDFGWMTEGRIAARFERLTLPIRSSNDELMTFELRLEDAWVTAKLEDGPEGRRLTEGRVGGRLEASALLGEVGLLYDTTSSRHICDDPSLFLLSKARICKGLDLRHDHCEDFQDLACDSFSFGAGFEAKEIAALGEPHERTDAEWALAERLPREQRCRTEAGTPVDAAAFDCP